MKRAKQINIRESESRKQLLGPLAGCISQYPDRQMSIEPGVRYEELCVEQQSVH
jgi:hypothetical protein